MNHDQREEDKRLVLLNSFMTCPHRDTTELNNFHAELQAADPVFYAHLATWYMKNGDVRDHKEIFTARLCVDPYLPNRDVGIALWQRLPFFLKYRAITFLKGKYVKIREKLTETISVGKRGKSKKTIHKTKIEKKRVGLEKNIPTTFSNEIKNYLAWLENNPDKFDAVAARNRKDLKSLYVFMACKHGDRANDILFKDKYPEDSKLKQIQNIAKETDPIKQAKAIVEQKIPFTTAIGMVDNPTPAVWVALIEAMSPQEAINHVATFEEKGLMNNPATKELIMKKLGKAEKSKSVAALKSKEAQKSGRIQNEDVKKQLDKIADKQIQKSGTIKVPTAIMVDKSGSMETAISVGKHVAAMVSGSTTAPLTVLAFDRIAQPVRANGNTLSAWEAAFAPIHAHGGTSMGSCMDYLIRQKIIVEQIVFITDENEHETPCFSVMYKKYAELFKVTPHVVVIFVLGNEQPQHTLTRDMKSAGIEFDTYNLPNKKDQDYYALPGLITMLARKTKTDLLYEILDVPFPARIKTYSIA